MSTPEHRSRLDELLGLEFGDGPDFDDPHHEWRRLFAELLGTFFLVLVGAGGAVVGAASDGAISRTAAVTAPGLMVMAIILFMGAISGAHLNPAVTLAFSAARRLPLAARARLHHRPAGRGDPGMPLPLGGARKDRRARRDRARARLLGL